MKQRRFYKILICFILVLATILFTSCAKDNFSSLIANPLSQGYAVLQFLDVGQADCSLLSLPDGRHILIDGGNFNDGEEIIKHLNALNIKKIDYVVCTHPHEDHIGGIPTILSYFDVGSIILPKIAKDDVEGTEVYEILLIAIKEKGSNVIEAKAGRNIVDEGKLKIDCLGPCSDSYAGLNDYSAVMKIRYGETEIIFAGDAEFTSENEMINRDIEILDADILKVGHHGSKTATNQDFLEAVSPKYAVISCGEDNQYNHPDNETLKRLKDFETIIYRTDEMGSVVFHLDLNGVVNVTTTTKICLDGD